MDVDQPASARRAMSRFVQPRADPKGLGTGDANPVQASGNALTASRPAFGRLLRTSNPTRTALPGLKCRRQPSSLSTTRVEGARSSPRKPLFGADAAAIDGRSRPERGRRGGRARIRYRIGSPALPRRCESSELQHAPERGDSGARPKRPGAGNPNGRR